MEPIILITLFAGAFVVAVLAAACAVIAFVLFTPVSEDDDNEIEY